MNGYVFLDELRLCMNDDSGMNEDFLVTCNTLYHKMMDKDQRKRRERREDSVMDQHDINPCSVAFQIIGLWGASIPCPRHSSYPSIL